MLAAFGDRGLPVDVAVDVRCAKFHVPDRTPERAALIAATAIVHGLTVVTPNTVHFAASSVRQFGPWQA